MELEDVEIGEIYFCHTWNSSEHEVVDATTILKLDEDKTVIIKVDKISESLNSPFPIRATIISASERACKYGYIPGFDNILFSPQELLYKM